MFLLESKLSFSLAFRILYDPAQMSLWKPKSTGSQHLNILPTQPCGACPWPPPLSLPPLCLRLKSLLLSFCHSSAISPAGETG